MQDLHKKRIVRALIVPAILLVVPLMGQLTVEGWNWDWHEFLFAYVLWTITALTYVRVTKHVTERTDRFFIGLVVFGVLAFIWGILATS